MKRPTPVIQRVLLCKWRMWLPTLDVCMSVFLLVLEYWKSDLDQIFSVFMKLLCFAFDSNCVKDSKVKLEGNPQGIRLPVNERSKKNMWWGIVF